MNEDASRRPFDTFLRLTLTFLAFVQILLSNTQGPLGFCQLPFDLSPARVDVREFPLHLLLGLLQFVLPVLDFRQPFSESFRRLGIVLVRLLLLVSRESHRVRSEPFSGRPGLVRGDIVGQLSIVPILGRVARVQRLPSGRKQRCHFDAIEIVQIVRGTERFCRGRVQRLRWLDAC